MPKSASTLNTDNRASILRSAAPEMIDNSDWLKLVSVLLYNALE